MVKRAVDVCDPDGTNAALGDFLLRFEDADEPVSAIANLEERVAIAAEGIDLDVLDPSVSMASATVIYLAHRRDEIGDDPAHVLRLAARAEWKRDPPEAVVQWLGERGVSI